jgi:glutamate-1-semialdehyde 2,1-aminomutase
MAKKTASKITGKKSGAATRPSERYAQSIAAHARAKRLMPGGVSSPVRAFKAVDATPITVREARGCWLTDVDGHRYVDYVGSYGPLVLGHAPETIVAAITKSAGRGTSFGMPSETETGLAECITKALPAVELVRFVNSGTEAVMSALRLARAATGRDAIVKCIGGYHGHVDSLLVQAGSGATTLGTPSSPGVPKGMTDDTLLIAYNDLDACAKVFAEHGERIAAMIVEPIAGNMGCVPPAEGYLQGLRKLCDEHDALLIFDEVMTGFRVAWGGAQTIDSVKPDLTCLGKIIGGGLPCAAYGGREELMRKMSPDGPVYQAGTLSGNPLAMAAGLATLEALSEEDAYKQLDRIGGAVADLLVRAAKKAGVAVQVNRVGSMLTPFFTEEPVTNYAGATRCDTARFAVFFRQLLDEGVTIPPSQYEAWFVSLAHDDEALQHTEKAVGKAMRAVAKKSD